MHNRSEKLYRKCCAGGTIHVQGAWPMRGWVRVHSEKLVKGMQSSKSPQHRNDIAIVSRFRFYFVDFVYLYWCFLITTCLSGIKSVFISVRVYVRFLKMSIGVDFVRIIARYLFVTELIPSIMNWLSK